MHVPASDMGPASECIASTNTASVGSRRTSGCVPVNIGPAGSSPEIC